MKSHLKMLFDIHRWWSFSLLSKRDGWVKPNSWWMTENIDLFSRSDRIELNWLLMSTMNHLRCIDHRLSFIEHFLHIVPNDSSIDFECELKFFDGFHIENRCDDLFNLEKLFRLNFSSSSLNIVCHWIVVGMLIVVRSSRGEDLFVKWCLSIHWLSLCVVDIRSLDFFHLPVSVRPGRGKRERSTWNRCWGKEHTSQARQWIDFFWSFDSSWDIFSDEFVRRLMSTRGWGWRSAIRSSFVTHLFADDRWINIDDTKWIAGQGGWGGGKMPSDSMRRGCDFNSSSMWPPGQREMPREKLTMFVDKLNTCLNVVFLRGKKQLWGKGSTCLALELELEMEIEIDRRSSTEFQQCFPSIEITANESVDQRNQMEHRCQSVNKRTLVTDVTTSSSEEKKMKKRQRQKRNYLFDHRRIVIEHGAMSIGRARCVNVVFSSISTGAWDERMSRSLAESCRFSCLDKSFSQIGPFSLVRALCKGRMSSMGFPCGEAARSKTIRQIFTATDSSSTGREFSFSSSSSSAFSSPFSFEFDVRPNRDSSRSFDPFAAHAERERGGHTMRHAMQLFTHPHPHSQDSWWESEKNNCWKSSSIFSASSTSDCNQRRKSQREVSQALFRQCRLRSYKHWRTLEHWMVLAFGRISTMPIRALSFGILLCTCQESTWCYKPSLSMDHRFRTTHG